ncbi:FtsX-like permease family protein [Deltaproteobacteria bacterium TL4]
MVIFQLGLKNVLSGGLRTWLNTLILSLTFVCIIAMQGMYQGMYDQISQIRISDELGQGQYWHPSYDPLDPLSLEDSHAPIPDVLHQTIRNGNAVPLLIIPATAYPEGRIQSVLLKGIIPHQNVLSLPTKYLNSSQSNTGIPAMIGNGMSKQTGLTLGDSVTIRWRNSDGAFDALELSIVHVFETLAPAVDQGQIWISLSQLQEMYQTPNHATLIIMNSTVSQEVGTQWKYQSLEDLLEDTKQFVKAKSSGGKFLYFLLLFLSMIAIFDTQALSIFRRKKEVGTLMAMGFTSSKVTWLFTLEGVIQGLLAALLAIFYGGPLCWYLATTGYSFPISGQNYGIALGNRLYSTYDIETVIGTFIIIMSFIALVSYWPARKISGLLPAEALRGRWT